MSDQIKLTASAETIARTIVLAFALINQLLLTFGKNPLPFSDDEVYGLISIVFTVGASLWAWWKNNSFTKAAIEADQTMKEIKNKE